MPLPWTAPTRRSLTMWALLAIPLLAAGCHWRGQCYTRLSNPFVCPTCDARSVEQCCCFPNSENAGYNETTWAPLQRSYDRARLQPADPIYLPDQTQHFDELEYEQQVESLQPAEDLEPPAQAEDGDTNIFSREFDIEQASAVDYVDEQTESGFVSEAEWVSEPEPVDEPDLEEEAPPVDDDYQPLADYFRSATVER